MTIICLFVTPIVSVLIVSNCELNLIELKSRNLNFKATTFVFVFFLCAFRGFPVSDAYDKINSRQKLMFDLVSVIAYKIRC